MCQLMTWVEACLDLEPDARAGVVEVVVRHLAMNRELCQLVFQEIRRSDSHGLLLVEKINTMLLAEQEAGRRETECHSAAEPDVVYQ
jgi:hypothetical protein